MTSDPDAIAVHRMRREVLLSTDEVVKMDKMFDANGDDTDDPMAAMACTARLPDGRWLAVDLTQFEEAKVQ